MSEKLLTIGMSTYDDYDGVYFSVQALRMYQLLGLEDLVEILVIDNNPESPHGKETKKFIENSIKGTYIPYTEKISSFNKYKVFEYARGKYTLIIDCHVLLEKDAIINLLDYYKNNEETKNLITGPLLYDSLKNISTHFEKKWGGCMYGTWAFDKKKYEEQKPFEIPMMGTGLLSCKTSNWVGINKNFIGFGGEEGYIHEKFKKAGGECICLPNLKWVHRFNRPNGVPYPNILEDRLNNYFIGWLEILKDPNHLFFNDIIEEFQKNIPLEIILNIFKKCQEKYDK